MFQNLRILANLEGRPRRLGAHSFCWSLYCFSTVFIKIPNPPELLAKKRVGFLVQVRFNEKSCIEEISVTGILLSCNSSCFDPFIESFWYFFVESAMALGVRNGRIEKYRARRCTLWGKAEAFLSLFINQAAELPQATTLAQSGGSFCISWCNICPKKVRRQSKRPTRICFKRSNKISWQLRNRPTSGKTNLDVQHQAPAKNRKQT